MIAVADNLTVYRTLLSIIWLPSFSGRLCSYLEYVTVLHNVYAITGLSSAIT